ncbi:hypothetical protein SpCBS45565_g07261 [Spizellomyces sp. 'palustris']|nr:hypothetical protein SpCBS45565_g07261 [Spizellomyces sp. 'palustris']
MVAPVADTVEDMTTLSELTEGAIMENLKKRYAARKIYTFTGSILVALNPFEKMDIYNLPTLKQYTHRRHNENPPHIFAIAETAYANVRNSKINQSVIISGESGAGKSESTKVILQYLTTVTSKESQESWVEQQILEANTVLESFGNAKTVRNNNSSRFGKFIQINFNRYSQIIGASIVNYLLEKSRIAKQAPDERNYHIFYELVAGVNDAERQSYMLEAADSYYYLNQSGCIDIPYVDDSKNFEGLKLALTVLKMSPVDQDALFRALSAILWIGNMQFKEEDNKESVKVRNMDVIEKVASLMGINGEHLKTALCFKKLVIRGETSMVPYKLNQANDTRDSFAKAVYDSLFQRMVEFINKSLTSKEKPANFVGVLDIFGFEVFKLNSFEQFCINYTNEKLQQFFNQFIFKIEQEEYDKEDIKWDKIQFHDNAQCLELIEAKPAGILSLLDEETRFPKGTDDSWLSKLDQAHMKQPHYIKAKTQKGVFGVRHYAGDVNYTVATFLDKNKDAIQEELYELVRGSSVPYIAKVFPKEEKDDSGKGPRGGKPTAGTQFRNQLVSLVTTLAATTPHYVRCIKPNQEKEAFHFDDDMVLAQLRYSGMLDTIRIRKAGYPMRLPYDGFVREFKCLIPAGMVYKKEDVKKISIGIAAEANLGDGGWQAGKTKLFLKQDSLAAIQDRAAQVLRAKVVLLQKCMLGYMYRQRYLQMLKAAKVLQTYIKGFICKRRYKKTTRAILKIQAVARGWFARDYYRQMLAEKRAAEKKVAEKRMAEKRTAEMELEVPEATKLSDIGQRRASVGEAPTSLPASREDGEKLIGFAKVVNKKKETTPSAMPTDLALSITPAAAKKEGGEIDNLFAFLGDFDPTKRTALIKGADVLAEMAAALTADIDSLFDEPPPSTVTRAVNRSVTNLAAPAGRQSVGVRPQPLEQKGTPRQSVASLNASRDDLATGTGKASQESLVEKIDYNSREFAMEVYAQKHLEQHLKANAFATITKKRQTVDMQEMLSYTKVIMNPISMSMTKIPNKTEALDHLAVDSFKLLMKATEPGARKAEELIQAYIGNGIHNPEIRDELFVQMIKQVTLPKETLPKSWEQMMVNGWQILTLAAASFPPSKIFAKFLLGFVHRTVDHYVTQEKHVVRKLAIAAEEAVKRVMLNGARKIPPSTLEITTLKSGGVLPCRFSLLDGRELDIAVGLTTTAGDIVKDIARKIELRDSTGWSLFEVTLRSERAVKATDYIADFIAAWDKDKDPKKKDAGGTIRRKKGETLMTPAINIDASLVLKKRVFRNIHEQVTDPVEYALLYAQAVDGVARDLYPITERVAMQMAALRAQVLLGDCDAASAEARFVKELNAWVAPRLVPNQPREAWVQGIVKQYQKLRATTAEEAKVLYLESVKEFKHYGAALFPVKHKGFWPYSESILLAVFNEGIDFVHPRTNETILSFAYKDVKSYEHENGLVTIMAVPASDDAEFEATEVYQFFTDQAEEIVSLIREYCPTTEYMKKVKESYVQDMDIASLVRDVEKYRIALLEHGIMRRPGPDGGPTKRGKWSPLRRLVTTSSRNKPATSSSGLDGNTTLQRKLSTGSRKATDDQEKMASDEGPASDESIVRSPSFAQTPSLEETGVNQGNIEDYTNADWSFSMKPLVTSLISLSDPEVEVWAAEASNTLHSFIGTVGGLVPDVATGNIPALQEIIEKCLELPYLANELYLQLIKYTTNHPEADSMQAINMWKLMSIVTGVLAPSGWILEYAKAHLRRCSVVDMKAKKPRTEEAQHARHSLRTLHKTIGAGPRKCPPSRDEALQAAKLTPLRIRFHLMDGQSRAIPIEAPDTCEMVYSALLERVKLQALHGFAIYEHFGGIERALNREEKIADSLYRWEKIAKAENRTEHVRFVFKKRIFLDPLQPCKTDAEEKLVRAQALADVAGGVFPVTEDEAIFLAALHAQAHYGDVNYDSPVNYQNLCSSYIPQRYRQVGVEKKVEEKHMEFLGTSALQANTEVSQFIRSWPYYGCTIFEVGQNYSKDIPSSCWLAVSPTALHIFARLAKTPLITHPYNDVVSFSPSLNSLLLITGSQSAGSKYVFTTPQATELAALIREYMDIALGTQRRAAGGEKPRGSHLHLAGGEKSRPFHYAG